MKKTLLYFLMTLCFAAGVRAQQDKCERFSNAEYGVSFCAPTGWTVGEVKGAGKVLYGDRSGAFTRSIMMRGAAMPVTVEELADAGTLVILNAKPGGMTKIEQNGRTRFTAGKSRGVKVVFKAEYDWGATKTIQYHFEGKGKYRVTIRATILWSDPDDLEKQIDAAVTTFEVTK
ncbi:MAG TPA: hypothetical protein VIL74_07105 [Pyrinomonadaceae bacterium]|jgi:hypothetical protein